MPVIGEADREYIRAEFARQLEGEVKLVLFVRPEVTRLYVPGRQPGTSRETRELLEDLASLSEKITLEVHDVSVEPEAAAAHGIDPEVLPALIVEGRARGRVRFFGLPAGYEFRTLFDTIIAVSRGESGLSEQARAEIEALTEPVHLQVFVTPT